MIGLTGSTIASSIDDINSTWVQGLTHNGKYLYTSGGSAHSGLYPINMNSTRVDLMRAYPNDNFSYIPDGYRLIDMNTDIIYKR